MHPLNPALNGLVYPVAGSLGEELGSRAAVGWYLCMVCSAGEAKVLVCTAGVAGGWSTVPVVMAEISSWRATKLALLRLGGWLLTGFGGGLQYEWLLLKCSGRRLVSIYVQWLAALTVPGHEGYCGGE